MRWTRHARAIANTSATHGTVWINQHSIWWEKKCVVDKKEYAKDFVAIVLVSTCLTAVCNSLTHPRIRSTCWKLRFGVRLLFFFCVCFFFDLTNPTEYIHYMFQQMHSTESHDFLSAVWFAQKYIRSVAARRFVHGNMIKIHRKFKMLKIG